MILFTFWSLSERSLLDCSIGLSWYNTININAELNKSPISPPLSKIFQILIGTYKNYSLSDIFSETHQSIHNFIARRSVAIRIVSKRHFTVSNRII